MQRQWLTDRQLTPGTVVFDWQREFSLWGYTGSHSVMLFRSLKADPGDAGPATRIDIVFKPVKALSIRTRYRTLAVRVASQERSDRILGQLGRAYPDDRVLELVGPDGTADHVVCMAAGWHEDDGESWEPSPFAVDLTDGRTPSWRARVLGGGPDGEMTARIASLDEFAAAVRPSGGGKGRYLFLVMMQPAHPLIPPDAKPKTMSAFLTRDEAEEYIREMAVRDAEYWVDVVGLQL